jgi:hypothetical protein
MLNWFFFRGLTSGYTDHQPSGGDCVLEIPGRKPLSHLSLCCSPTVTFANENRR